MEDTPLPVRAPSPSVLPLPPPPPPTTAPPIPPITPMVPDIVIKQEVEDVVEEWGGDSSGVQEWGRPAGPPEDGMDDVMPLGNIIFNEDVKPVIKVEEVMCQMFDASSYPPIIYLLTMY